MSEIRKVAQNTIVQILGKVLTITLSLISFGLIARYLGQEGFGYYTTIYAFLSVFGILVDLGLQMTTTQLISDPRNNEQKVLSNALTIRLVASVAFLGLAPIVVLFFPYPSTIKIGVAVAAMGFVFSSMISTIISFFQKYLIMQKVALAEIGSKLIFLLSIMVIIAMRWGLLAIIAGIVIESLFNFSILFYFASKKIIIKPSFDPVAWKIILSRTWPIALTIALNLIYFKGDILIMSLLRSQSEVGLYGAPYKILEVLINIAYLFLGLILPILATAAAMNNTDKLKRIIQSTFDFLVIVGVPLVVGGFFVGQQLMIFVAGPEFVISGEIMKILLIATVIIFISGLFGYAVVALNQQKTMIKFYAINAVVSIIGYVILIAKYSYWGAAWMTVFTEFFILITAGYVLKNKINFWPRLGVVGKSILAALVMAFPLYVFSDTHFGLLIPMGAFAYFMTLYLLKGFDEKIVLEIINIKSNEPHIN